MTPSAENDAANECPGVGCSCYGNVELHTLPSAEKDAACPVCGLDYLTECSCTRQPPPDAEKESDESDFIQCPHEVIRATCAGYCNCDCGPCEPSRPRPLPPGGGCSE